MKHTKEPWIVIPNTKTIGHGTRGMSGLCVHGNFPQNCWAGMCRQDFAKAQQAEIDRLAALNAELVEKLEEADSLAKLAIHLNKEFKARMDECSERFTHKDGCMRRLAYRKLGWPCSCEAIAKAGVK